MRVAITGDVPDTPELTELERAIFAAALAGDRFAALREQADAAEVVSRTGSGVGFVTRLRLPDGVATAGEVVVPVVYGRHPALPEPAEFMLQLKDGRLHTIEAFCFQGMWPADEAGFEFTDGAA
jgi:hypothetical protein